MKRNFIKKKEKTSYFQKKRINFSRIFYGFFSLVFVGVTGYVLFFSGFLNILNREFSPTEKIDSQKLSDRLDVLLGEKYWGIVPKNNLLLLRESYLNNLFTREFGMVKRIEIAKKFPDKIKITVEERQPAIILENSQGKFVLDKETNVYPYNFFDSSDFDLTELPILKETNAERAFSFENNSGSNYLDFIFKVKDKLEKLLDIPVEKAMTVSKIISGDVFFTTKEGWQIYFNKNVAIDKEIEMLRIVLEEKIGKEKRPDLEYIDLRISNKILYRFKETQPENTSIEKSENKDKK
ncbi:hypothetical protein KJ761_03170 [Patescibacteria group bacterium]|nr:hypothetical protein [Patescibacteria group bacterium]